MRRGCVVAAAAWLHLCSAVASQAADPCDVSMSFVDFGRLDLRRGGEITGEVAIDCDLPTTFALALSPGHGDYPSRRLRGPSGGELRYNLYLDPGHHQVWGDGTSAGTARLAGQSDGRERAIFVIYGRIPPDQSVRAGTYSDQLMVTFTSP
jgi:spore coat protein U-like protein